MSRLYLNTKTGTTFLFIAAVLTIALIMALPAYAQTTDDPTDDDPFGDFFVEIVGEVDFVADEDFPDIYRLTVGGVIVAPAGAFIPADLRTGDVVRIVGYLLDDDTILAISLEFVDPDELEEEPVVTPEPTEEPEVTPEPTEEPEVTPTPLPATCVPLTHPIAVSTAAAFEMTVEEVVALHCAGYGFGDIIRALVLERESDYEYTVEELLEMGDRGESWHAVMAEVGVHPSQLAPGLAIRPPGRPDFAGPPWMTNPEDDDEDGATTSSAPGDRPGGPPGQNPDRPGGPPAGGPPGQNPDRPGGPPAGGPPGQNPGGDRPGGGPPENPGGGRGGRGG